jgi:hypothetical protein
MNKLPVFSLVPSGKLQAGREWRLCNPALTHEQNSF